MPTRPEIFISATSQDLRSCRQLVRDALLTMGCVPVVQDHFAPDARTVREMLRARIAACDAVIHLTGECYGAEPFERDAAEPRRSYTQMEYDMARALRKPIYTFLCAPDFPYDAHDPEPPDLRVLQDAHRAALQARDDLYQPIASPQQLDLHVRELQTRVELLSRDLQRTRSWLGRGVAAALVALALIGAGLFALHQHARRAEAKMTQVSDELDRYRQAVKALADNFGKDITPGRKLTDQEKFDHALAAEAERQKISVDELKTWMALFVAQVRANPGADFYDQALADFAEKHFADAAANATRAADQYHTQREAAEKEAATASERARQARTKERLALTLEGDAQKAAGHYADEIAPYQQALDLTDKTREPLLWCDAAQNLEYGLRQMGRYDEAVPLAREVMDRRTALLGPEHPDTLTSVNLLVLVLTFKGDNAGAEPLARHAMEMQERLRGKEHPDTLKSIVALALVLYHKGDYAEAEALDRRCLEARERTLGKDHHDTLVAANNLGAVINAEGKRAEAEALYRRILETQERTLGRDHPSTLICATNLASVLEAEGKYAEAEVLVRRALEVQERTLGKDHPYTLRSVDDLADALSVKGDLAGAATLYRRCLETRERTLDKDHPDTLHSMMNLGICLYLEGDYAAAEPLLRRVMETRERILGPDNATTLNDVNNYAQLLAAEGDDAAAEPLYVRTLTGMERALPPEDTSRLDLDYYFSLFRQKQNRLADALPLAEHAAAGAAKSLPADNPDRLKYEKNLADLRAKMAAASPSPAPTP